jgi:hypothetical protein
LQLHSFCLVGEAEESAPLVFRATIFCFPFAAAEQIPHLRVQIMKKADSVPVLQFGMARRVGRCVASCTIQSSKNEVARLSHVSGANSLALHGKGRSTGTFLAPSTALGISLAGSDAGKQLNFDFSATPFGVLLLLKMTG